MKAKMKKMLKKATIIMLITCVLLLNSVSGTVLAGPAKGDEYNLNGLDLSKATVKPTLTVSTHKNVEKGNSVTVTITVGNAEGKYATTGIWLNYAGECIIIMYLMMRPQFITLGSLILNKTKKAG